MPTGLRTKQLFKVVEVKERSRSCET